MTQQEKESSNHRELSVGELVHIATAVCRGEQQVVWSDYSVLTRQRLMTTIWDLTKNGSVEKYNHLTISEDEENNIINKLDGLYLLNNKKILDFIRMFLGFISPLHALHYRNKIIKILSY